MKKASLIILSLFVLTGFKASLAQTEYGQGTLIVSPSVDEKYKKYLSLEEPLAFAISADGKSSSGSFCQQPGTCKDINGPQLALDRCNAASQKGSPCKLFAIERDVIWYGRISLKSDVGSGPIRLSIAAEKKFQKYLALDEPLAFGVSTDGQRSSGSFCQQPGTCADIDGPGLALERCHATAGLKGHPCKIFAIGKDIVWDGAVSLAEPTNDPIAGQHLQNILTPPSPQSPQPVVEPVIKAPRQPASQPKVSTPDRVRSSKAFRDLEDDIRRSQPTAQ